MSEQAGERTGDWPLIVALALCQLVSWGSIYNGFVLFVAPMEAEFGWSRAAINGAASLGLLVMGGCAFLVGRWIDGRGGRWMMTGGCLGAGLLLLAWSRVETLVGFYLVWLGMGIAMAAMLYQALFAALTRTYPRSYRTRITVVTLVAGFASTVFIPLTQVLIEEIGWRPTLVVFAAIQLLACAPIHAFWLRDGGGGRMQAGTLAAGSRARWALRQPAFWGLALCFTATSAINAVVWFHAVPLFLERGFRTVDVVAAMALIGPVQVAGRLVVFALGRRATTANYGRLALGLQPFVFAVPLVWSDALPGLYAFTILYGAVNGVMTIARATSIAEFLGLEGYGAISGLIAAPATIAHAAAPYVTAFLWARFGGYGEVLTILLAASVAATAGFWFAADRARRADKTLAGRAGLG